MKSFIPTMLKIDDRNLSAFEVFNRVIVDKKSVD